jgi:hypothetical protein
MQQILLNSINYGDFINELRAVVRDELSKSQSEQPTTPTQRDFLTADELSSWLNLSKVSLWRYEKRGLLHPQKIGSKKLYSYEEIKENLLTGAINDQG